jgi:pyruvate carboxylase subunit B
MQDNGWDVGQDEEELFELAMHERQYLDYKSGIAKKRFEEEVEKARQQQNQSQVVAAAPQPTKPKEEKTLNNLPNDELHKQLTAPITGQVVFGFHEIIEDKFVKIGDTVKKGERICYIYSDLFQGFEEVVSPVDGVITHITVKQGSTVKKGEVIAVVKVNQPVVAEK